MPKTLSTDLRERLRPAGRFPCSGAGFGLSVDRLLDVIEFANSIERLFGDRRVGGFVEVEQLPLPLGPASSLFDEDHLGLWVRLVHGIEAGEAVGLENAATIMPIV